MDAQQVKALEKRFVMVEANTDHTGYLDMMLMSKCNHNVISNSSFSWWAAWLNRNPDKLIVAPDKWVNDKECSDVYTKGMVLVNAKGRVNCTIK